MQKEKEDFAKEMHRANRLDLQRKVGIKCSMRTLLHGIRFLLCKDESSWY